MKLKNAFDVELIAYMSLVAMSTMMLLIFVIMWFAGETSVCENNLITRSLETVAFSAMFIFSLFAFVRLLKQRGDKLMKGES